MTETVIFEDENTGVYITYNDVFFIISRPSPSDAALGSNKITMSPAEFTALGSWFIGNASGKQK